MNQMHPFDRDIALTAISKTKYKITISDAWNVTNGPNGGYIATFAPAREQYTFTG